MTLNKIMRGTGIALIVATGLSLAGCGSCNTPAPQPAPEQPQQFENAKDRISCRKAKKHHKKEVQQEQSSTEQQPAEQQ